MHTVLFEHWFVSETDLQSLQLTEKIQNKCMVTSQIYIINFLTWICLYFMKSPFHANLIMSWSFRIEKKKSNKVICNKDCMSFVLLKLNIFMTLVKKKFKHYKTFNNACNSLYWRHVPQNEGHRVVAIQLFWQMVGSVEFSRRQASVSRSFSLQTLFTWCVVLLRSGLVPIEIILYLKYLIL